MSSALADRVEPGESRVVDGHRVPAGMVALFLLLVTTVGATTGVLSMSAWLWPRDHALRMADALKRCFDVIGQPGDSPTAVAFNDAAHRAVACLAPVQREQASWALYGIVVLAVVAVAFYCAYPRWLVRRRRLTPLREQGELATYLAELRGIVGLRTRPVYLLGSQTGTLDAVTFGGFRRRYIALDAGLLRSFTTDRAKFRAVVLHELAHARSQDVHITYLTKSIWWAFVLVVWVPTLVLVAIDRSWSALPDVVALLALTALVLLTRNAILRERELHADGVAAAYDGPSTALGDLVASMDAAPRSWRMLLAHHPHPARRRRVIADPTLLLRPRWWEMPVVGLSVAVIATNLQYLVMTSLPTLPGLNALLAGALVTPGVVVPLVIAAWRTVALAPSERPVRRLLLLAATLSAGYLVGEQVTVFALIHVSTNAAVKPPDLAATVLLLAGTTVVVLWAASAARSVFESFDRPPRWALPALVAGATAAFWAWFAIWFELGNEGLLGLWTFADELTPQDVTIPDAPGWIPTAAHWLGLVHMPLYYLTTIPVVVPFLALLWLTPIIVTRTGRPVLDVHRALRAGLLGAGVFALAAAALVLLARTGLSADARRSDGFRVGFHYALLDMAVVVQAGVAASVRVRHRLVLVPLAVLVSGLLSAVVLLIGVDTLGRAVNLWMRAPQRAFELPELRFAVATTQQVLLTGAVVAVIGVLIGAAFRRREPVSLPRRRRVALAVVTVAVVALGAGAVPNAYGTWITSSTNGTVELTGAACVLGTWVETSRQTTLTLDAEVGPMRFEGSGSVQAFGSDGSLVIQFAPAVSVTGGHVVKMVFSRSVTARYRVEDDRIAYSDVIPGVTWSVSVDDDQPVLTGDVTDFATDTFTCKDNAMTETGPGYSITMIRVAHEN